MQIETISAEKARLETNYTPSKIKLYIAHRLIDRKIAKASKKGQQQCQIKYLPFLLNYDKVKFLYLTEKVEKIAEVADKNSLEFETDNVFFNYIMEEYVKLGYFVELYNYFFVIGWGSNGIDKKSVYLKT